MKKILYSLIIMAAAFTACEDPGTDILYTETYLELDAATTVTGSKTFSYLRVNDGQGIPGGFIVTLGAAHQANPVNFTFEVDVAASTAIENLHYQLTGNTGTIAANSSTAELPIMVLDDNINPGETPTIVVKLTSGDVPINPNYATASHILQVLCTSDLAGTFDYVHTDMLIGPDANPCGPAEHTGTVTWEEIGTGIYTTTDLSFGQYDVCWNDAPAVSGSTRITDVCGTLGIEGGDQYGLIYTYTITGINGASLSLDWENTYNDHGKVVLTRQDGKNWPDLQ